MGHKRFKCACGMTTSLTGKDAQKATSKKPGIRPNYKPVSPKKSTK